MVENINGNLINNVSFFNFRQIKSQHSSFSFYVEKMEHVLNTEPDGSDTTMLVVEALLTFVECRKFSLVLRKDLSALWFMLVKHSMLHIASSAILQKFLYSKIPNREALDKVELYVSMNNFHQAVYSGIILTVICTSICKCMRTYFL